MKNQKTYCFFLFIVFCSVFAIWECFFSLQYNIRKLHPFIFQPSTNTYSQNHIKLRNGSLYGVTLVRNKGPFLKEWLDFHFNQGFDQFLIYNHNVSDTQTLDVLLPYILDNNRVILISALQTAPEHCSFQNELYVDHWFGTCQNFCFTQAFNIIRNFSSDINTWVGHFDIDEFMFGVGNKCLKTALKSIIVQIDVLYMKGLTFGTNGFAQNNQFDSVIQTHLHRAPNNKHTIIQKKLLRTSNQWIYETRTHDAYCIFSACRQFKLSPFNKYIRLHHYQFISMEENILKAKTNHNSYYNQISNNLDYFNTIYDPTILNVSHCTSQKDNNSSILG